VGSFPIRMMFALNRKRVSVSIIFVGIGPAGFSINSHPRREFEIQDRERHLTRQYAKQRLHGTVHAIGEVAKVSRISDPR